MIHYGGDGDDEHEEIVFFFQGTRFVRARPWNRQFLRKVDLPSASDLARRCDISGKDLSPMRIGNAKGLKPPGGTWSVVIQIDGASWELDYEVWDGVSDTNQQGYNETVINVGSWAPAFHESAVSDLNATPSNEPSPWIWSAEYSRY